MARYRKKPVVIDAVQYNGDNILEVEMFIALGDGEFSRGVDHLNILTLEGVMRASLGDYIIKGIRGEYYPCKSDIFEKTYEAE